eukprot:TRINITY_DN159_c0_g1_i1.p1 TRINITY_DN159_c0_g1~~TRINITY_DN159_c0_g1_i1.p1  ORF type:complete len:996 (+),score=366.62 TRINITY_DN159_c0_g1_i1:37-3024(+)
MAESDDDIRIDDDEEIDEEEAFNEEDYSLYEGIVPDLPKKRRHGRGGKSRKPVEDLDEDEEDDEEEDANDPDLKLLSDLFEVDDNERDQQDDEEEEEEDRAPSRTKSQKKSVSYKEENAHQNLLNVVSSLRSRPAKQTEQDTDESEFNIKRKSGSSALSLSELVRSVQPLKGFEQTRDLFKSLTQQLPANLEPTSVVKDRNDRIAAYKSIKSLVRGRWDPLVKEKSSQKTRIFPEPQPVLKQTTGDLNKKFNPINSFETDISSTLLDAGFSLDLEHEQNDLKPNPLNPLEVQKRMAEVRKLRWKLANEETKKAWMKKIKSKSYRRIKKKIRERKAEQAENAEELLDDDAEAERAAKADKLRALERVTMKHRANKFSKSLLRTNKQNPEDRKALQEQIQLHQALRAKMEDAEEDGTDALRDAELAEEMKAWREEDQMLKKEEKKAKEEGEEGGLMGMKFMKRAQEKAKAEALLRKSRGGEDYEKSEDEDESDDDLQKLKKTVSDLKKKEKAKKDKEDEMAVGHRREYNPSRISSSSSSSFVVEDESAQSSSKVTLVGESLQVSSVAFSNTRSTIMKTPISVRHESLPDDENEKKPDLPLLFEMAPFPSPSVPQPSINHLPLTESKPKSAPVPKVEKPKKETKSVTTQNPNLLDAGTAEKQDETTPTTPKGKGNKKSKKPSLRNGADQLQEQDEENPWLKPELLTRRSRDEKQHKKKRTAADSALQLDFNSTLLLGSNSDGQSLDGVPAPAPENSKKRKKTTGGFVEKVEKLPEKSQEDGSQSKKKKKPQLKRGEVPVTIIEKKTEAESELESESDVEEKREKTKGSRLIDLSTYSQEQKALVQRAFEPDEEAYQEFRSEWDKNQNGSDPTPTTQATLPGWGSWSANDKDQKKNNNRNKKMTPTPPPEEKPTKKKAKTVSNHVLTNELKPEKLKAFQTNKKQFQISPNDAPIGHAWNPGLFVEKKIAPESIVLPGLVIPALSRKENEKKPTPRKPLS